MYTCIYIQYCVAQSWPSHADDITSSFDSASTSHFSGTKVTHRWHFSDKRHCATFVALAAMAMAMAVAKHQRVPKPTWNSNSKAKHHELSISNPVQDCCSQRLQGLKKKYLWNLGSSANSLPARVAQLPTLKCERICVKKRKFSSRTNHFPLGFYVSHLALSH